MRANSILIKTRYHEDSLVTKRWSYVRPAVPGGPDAQRNCADDEHDADELKARRVIGLPEHHASDAERSDQKGEQVLHRVSCRRANMQPTLPVRWLDFVVAASNIGAPWWFIPGLLTWMFWPLLRPRNARILGELIDVAVRRTKVHPGIAALVLLGEQNLDSVGPKLIGDRPDVVHEKAGDRTGREVAIHVAVWSEDLHFAAVGQLQHAESRTVHFGSKAHEVSKEVSGLLEVLGARPYPGELDDLHTRTRTPDWPGCQLKASGAR
jgi:hypothetical protein